MLQRAGQPCLSFWPLAAVVEATAVCVVLGLGRSWGSGSLARINGAKAHKVGAVSLVNM